MSIDGETALFVTGTDTGVGKTYITAALTRTLRRRGDKVVALKPVATGAEVVGGLLVAEDTQILAAASGETDFGNITFRSYPEPVAPAVAAALHGERLAIGAIAGFINSRRQPGSRLLVEGVGGLLCPLTATETVADLVGLIQIPLLVVTRRGLGTLNHTLLTLEVAERRGLKVAGVIVNEAAPPAGVADMTNVNELRRWTGETVVVVVRHQCGIEPDLLPVIVGSN